MTKHELPLVALLISAFVLHGCAALLPSAKQTTKSPWKSYNDAKSAFDLVVPSQTSARQLKTLGFDLYSTPNIKILNYLDIAISTSRSSERSSMPAC